ncbi:hypothetical protein [Nocardioides humi]|uniref:hypothetical protein n=1 Tax=Nocardioides humi TaxID=449461 RepID=UPI0015E8669B|nr:hypothetical protein [Nocardioides humi]
MGADLRGLSRGREPGHPDLHRRRRPRRPDRPVERILLRQDGYVDTTTSCPGSARLPELDRGEDGPDTWELDDEGWLRVSYNDGALRCAADGVREDGFQLICENERQGLVMERRYGTPGIDLPPGVTPPAGIRP